MFEVFFNWLFKDIWIVFLILGGLWFFFGKYVTSSPDVNEAAKGAVKNKALQLIKRFFS